MMRDSSKLFLASFISAAVMAILFLVSNAEVKESIKSFAAEFLVPTLAVLALIASIILLINGIGTRLDENDDSEKPS